MCLYAVFARLEESACLHQHGAIIFISLLPPLSLYCLKTITPLVRSCFQVSMKKKNFGHSRHSSDNNLWTWIPMTPVTAIMISDVWTSATFIHDHPSAISCIKWKSSSSLLSDRILMIIKADGSMTGNQDERMAS